MLRVLGIDYGTRNFGLAISDDECKVAVPYQTISIKGDVKKQWNKVIEDLERIIYIEKVGTVVVGMPLNSQGERTKLGDQIFEFLKEFDEISNLKVEIMDERATSKMAGSLPHKTSRNIHELSAEIILQDYLDRANLKV